MRFVQCDGMWLLVDTDGQLIATVNGPVEVLALKGLCEARLQGDESPFAFRFGELTYRAIPYPDRGAKLSLKIEGSDGSLHRVETEFVFPDAP